MLNYGSIFWQCACLIVNSFTHTDDKGVNYGKLAKALTSIKSKHPSINNSKRGFSVNGEDIIYGLKPLIGVGEALTEEIISKRPFVSFEDFMNRVENKTNASILSLIKSGAFDEFGVSREMLMGEYIKSITKIKSKLTLSNVSEIFELEVLDKREFEKPLLFISVYKFVCSKSNLVQNEDLKGQWFKVIKEIEVDFLNLYDNLKGNEFIYNSDGLIVKKSAIEREMKKNSLEIMELLKSEEVLNNLNNKLIELSTKQYANGSIRRWEFDSMSSYKFDSHELDEVTLGKYNVVGFNSISEEPIIFDSGVSAKTGAVWKKFETQLITGTVVDKDKNNSYISLLTKDGLIGVRFNKGQFNHYDSSLSYIQSNGKKKVVDKSWFSKGTLLIIQGYRSEDEFRAKKYSDSILQNTCIKIMEIKDNDIKVQLERACVEV